VTSQIPEMPLTSDFSQWTGRHILAILTRTLTGYTTSLWNDNLLFFTCHTVMFTMNITQYEEPFNTVTHTCVRTRMHACRQW